MHHTRHSTAGAVATKGFTLVEILIVVVIVGIIAAIVVPQFKSFSAEASSAALKTDLTRIRNAIERYEADHGAFPTLESFEAQMTRFSSRDGGTSTTKDDNHRFGPYLINIPALPVGSQKGQDGITDTLSTEGFGWCYDAATGTIRANTADSEVDEAGVKFNAY